MKIHIIIKYSLITIGILSGAIFTCFLIKKNYNEVTLIPTILLLGTFLVCALTEGYVYGLVASVISVFVMNFAFTFPFFKIDFNMKENFLSAITLLAVTVITCGMTETIRRQENLRMESEKEKMRANLLRSISHDLRTPLTAIYGSSCALLENEKLSLEHKEQLLKGIKEESQWLYRMVENLLSITRIDENVNISKVDTVLYELIDSVIIKFKKRYENQEVNVKIPDELIIIPMDAILIEQVLLNLLENAVHHAIGMSRLELRVRISGNQAVFEVEDNGCGISKTKYEKIFEGCSSQHETPIDGKKFNAGIGLSVCSTIIKAHGSELKAENLKNCGAKFTFTLDMENSYEQQ